MNQQKSFRNRLRSSLARTESTVRHNNNKWLPFFRFVKGGKNHQTVSIGSLSSNDDDDVHLEENAMELSESARADNDECFTDKCAYEFVWDYHEQLARAVDVLPNTDHDHWKLFWEQYHTSDFLFVRPSGNSLSLKSLMAQLETGDITNYEEDVIMVENIKCFGQTAVLVYKSETRFLYKGNKVEDSRTNTIVLVWEDHRPKITNIQRSTGLDINETR